MKESFYTYPSYIIPNELASYEGLFRKYCTEKVTVPANTVISRSGENFDTMFFILKGMVKVYTTNAEGYVRILGYHGRGSLTAMDVISKGASAVVNVETITEVELLKVNKRDLRVIGSVDSEFPYALLEYYGYVLRLMCLDAEAKSLSDVKSKLVAFLCLCVRTDPDGRVIKMTRDELAGAVNASRVQVTRVCKELQEAGLIMTGKGRIEIIDLEALEEMSKL
jgi:CRP-like cAMP-binding protein